MIGFVAALVVWASVAGKMIWVAGSLAGSVAGWVAWVAGNPPRALQVSVGSLN